MSKQIGELDAAPPVSPPAGDQHQDRDPATVTAALWELDPCRLLAPGPGEPGAVDQTSPHGCTLTLDSAQIRVDLGRRLDSFERYQLDASDVAGAKAYLLHDDQSGDGCTAWLPVSFSRTIRFVDESPRCGRVRSVMERAVRRIGHASSRRPVPGLRHVNTCTLLRRGLGSQLLRGHQIAYGYNEMLGGVDRCVALSDERDPAALGSGDGYASLEVGTYADNALSGLPADFGTIRGREVVGERDSRGGGCGMRWAESSTIVTLEVESCEQGRAIITRMTKLLDDPPDERVRRQDPLLYRMDEPDRAARGVCVDYQPLWFGRAYTSEASILPPGPGCHPYIEPDLPNGAAETVAAAEADPNVTCAIAADAVYEEFPRRLRPATLDAEVPPIWRDQPPFRVRPCVFVDPRREIQVQVFVSSDPMPINQQVADGLAEHGADLGVPLVRYGWGYLVGLGEHPSDPGYVATFVGGRRQHMDDFQMYKLMNGSKDDAQRVAEAIVDQQLAAS